ncbi:MAG: ankyrin repeat domain-containing protein [Capsulimonadales bacterium]|nr:ankyrin repeat domain-containing protein [Capsulimonadales bacterium]
MALRHLPVRPNADQLKHQAKELLQGIRNGDPEALAEFQASHPAPPAPDQARLTDAQRALARSYGVSSWPRLALACQLIDAIWNEDVETVRRLILRHPRLRDEDARGVRGNWGPPLSHAATAGKFAVVRLLRELGAQDVQYAFDRASMKGHLEIARYLQSAGAHIQKGVVMGPCEALNGVGLRFLLELGADLSDDQGDPLAPVGMVLETYSRNPPEKHDCLEAMASHGLALPDTAPMALHRGRIDLLERHLKNDPELLGRTFPHEAIYPPSLGCHTDHSLALHGTPIAGGTLLHLAVDFDEYEMAHWLLNRGAAVDARAEIDADGFGGHTALFGCVVSQSYRTNCRRDDAFARLLLDHGADRSILASLRKRLRFVEDETEHFYRNVTPLEWGRRFHDPSWVNPAVMALL